jgi:hypothetical protein
MMLVSTTAASCAVTGQFVRIWSIFERAEVARLIHGGEDPIVAFSPDDMSAATASEDGTAVTLPESCP